jgi:hypothetical protein
MAICERLPLLRVGEITQDRLPELLCMNTPWVPHLWPPPQTNCDVRFANFPQSGDLPDPTGKGVAHDSAWRLRERARAGGTGDPGCSAMDFICDPWGYYGREVHLLY